MDPIDFRIKNDTQVDMGEDKPFSSRLLKECLRIGADKFGWEKRKMQPRTNKNGNWLIGYGVSAASRRAPYMKTSAKVALELKQNAVNANLKMDATDIGTGTYTIVAQTVSEYLSIPVLVNICWRVTVICTGLPIILEAIVAIVICLKTFSLDPKPPPIYGVII